LHRFIEKVAGDMRCTVLAINGVEDHIHVLLSLPSTVTIAELAKRMKGAYSHFVNEKSSPVTSSNGRRAMELLPSVAGMFRRSSTT